MIRCMASSIRCTATASASEASPDAFLTELSGWLETLREDVKRIESTTADDEDLAPGGRKDAPVVVAQFDRMRFRVSYITHDVDHRQQSQPPLRPAGGGTYPSGNKPKTTPGLTLSDEDDPEGPTADQNSADDGKRKTCPWQRMKWTDNMVRLLIMVVYYIGDEVGSEGNSTDPAAGNKKKVGAGVLQKKGKWKSVSRAMMERGFYVSPQQCEDKFNDLNKRYKG
nr:stress response protein NST1 [Ipomoea batatas]